MKPASRTRVKICGITRIDDALAAANAGADAIGLVFWRGTPRKVEFEQARAIAAAVPAFVTVVGLFVDPQPAEVHATLDAVPLDILQFHGNEPQALCASFARPYIKAVAVRPDVDLLQYAARYRDARAVLFDAFEPGGMPGGTGRTLDWGAVVTRLEAGLAQPLILSGGLAPHNVGGATGHCGRGESTYRAAWKRAATTADRTEASRTRRRSPRSSEECVVQMANVRGCDADG
jgi:Phosphoribosylanthranilate isomerase